MSFTETLANIRNEYESAIKALEVSIAKKKEEYSNKIIEVNLAIESGFENMEEYNLWKNLDQTCEEFLTLEAKRLAHIPKLKINKIQSKQDYYEKACDAIKLFSPKAKQPLKWVTITKKIKDGKMKPDEILAIVDKVIEQGIEAHYENLYAEACESGCRVYCQCGSILHLPSNRCENGTKHYFRREELDEDFLHWDYNDFSEEPPIIVD